MSNNPILRYLDERTGNRAAREELQKKVEQLSAETQSLQGAIQYLVEEAYWEGPSSITPDTLLGKLGELDSGLIDDLIDRRQWDVLGGMGASVFTDVESARRRAIDNSRYLFVYNPLVKWMINVWTNYGLGDSVAVSCENEAADPIFQEFWDADRNADVLSADTIQYLSIFSLQDGNTFLAFFASKADGRVTVEEIPVDEITEIISAPERASEKLFYKRVYQDSKGRTRELYYPDWQAKFTGRLTKGLADRVLPSNYERADESKTDDVVLNDIEEKLGTDVVILHIPYNRMVRKSHWGWPLLSSSTYVKSHKRFFEDRLTVSAMKAMYVRRKQVQGGGRAVASVARSIQSTLSASNYRETNQPAGAGGIEIENQSVKTTDLPMATGASDAKADNEMFSWMALLEGGLFPTTAGMDTTRWATALAMDKTLAMQWSRYQTFWTGQFKRMVKIVLSFAELYGGVKFLDADGNQDFGATISIDTLSLVDFPDVVSSLSTAVRDMLAPFLADGTIPENTGKAILRELWLIMLQALGLSSSSDIASKEAFGVVDQDQVMALPEPVQALYQEIKDRLKSGDWAGLAEYFTESE